MDVEKPTSALDISEKFSSQKIDNNLEKNTSTAKSPTEMKQVIKETPADEVKVDQSAKLIDGRSSTGEKNKMTDIPTLPDKLNGEKVKTTDKTDNHEPISKKQTPMEEDKSTCAKESDEYSVSSAGDRKATIMKKFNSDEHISDDESCNHEWSCTDGSWSDEESCSDGGSDCSDEELTDDDDDSARDDKTDNGGKESCNEHVSSEKDTKPNNEEQKPKVSAKSSKVKTEATEGKTNSVDKCSSEKQAEKKNEKNPAVPNKDSAEKRDVAEEKPTYAEITSAKRKSGAQENNMINKSEPTANKLVDDVKSSTENTAKIHPSSRNKSGKRASTSTEKKVSTSSKKGASTSSKKGASTSDEKKASTSSEKGECTSSETGASNPSEKGAPTSTKKRLYTSCEKKASTFSEEKASTSIKKREASSRKKRSSKSSEKKPSCDKPSGKEKGFGSMYSY